MKYLFILIAMALLLTGGVAMSDDLTLTNGKKFTNYRITRVEPDGLTIMHSEGITKVFFWEMSKQWQDLYKYNPESAKNYRATSRAQQTEINQRLQDDMRVSSAQRQYDSARSTLLESVKKGGGEITGKISQVTSKGIFIRNAYMKLYYRAEVVTPGHRVMEAQKTYETRTTGQSVAPSGEPVFVLGAGTGKSDGEYWTGVAYPAGTYRYTTVMSAEKTVKCFTLSPEAAVDKLIADQ